MSPVPRLTIQECLQRNLKVLTNKSGPLQGVEKSQHYSDADAMLSELRIGVRGAIAA